MIRGWIRYFGAFYRSALHQTLGYIDRTLARWAARKYKRFGRKVRKAGKWLTGVKQRDQKLFVHWYELKGDRTVG